MSQNTSHTSHTSHTSKPSHQLQQQAISAKEQTRAYVPGNQVSHKDIARRAFAIFEARGSTHGLDMQDWIVASRELTAEMQLS